MHWLLRTETGQIVLLALALLLVRLIVKYFLAVLIRRAIRSHGFESTQAERKREDTVINIVSTSLSVLLWIIGLIGLLAILHVNITGLLTGAGVVGVVVGLGAQNAIKDFVAGLFILIENQYRVSDIVTLNGFSGVVEKITLRITKLRDLDGNLHIIPNGSIKAVTNLTFGWSNVNMNIGVSYASDIDKVKSVLDDVGQTMAEDEAWKTDIMEPIAFLRVDEFGDSAVNVKALGKVVPGKQWEIAGEYRARVKKAFEKEGIEIPFPQRVIHQRSKTAKP